MTHSKLLLFALASSALISAQSIALSPKNLYIGVGLTQQFTATVTGLPTTQVTWSLLGMGAVNNPKLGAVTASGLYTAPAAIPAQNPVTLVATGSDGKTVGSTYILIEPIGPTLTSISPASIPVSGYTTYTVTITGSGFQSGARVLAGPYEIGTTSITPTQIVATGGQMTTGNVLFSVTNPGSTTSNTVTVAFVAPSGGPITVSPSSANVTLGSTQQFTATGQTGVTWTASAGAISSAGLYTAPATMPSSSTVTITASGTSNQKGTATVTLVAPSSGITVTPATSNVTLGGTQQFTATGQTGVTWTASAGSISTTGLFTAPATMPSSSTVTITATGTSNQKGTATVTLVAPAAPIMVTPSTANVTLGSTQQFTATGQTSVTWTASAGSINSAGLYTAPATMPSSSSVTIKASGSGNQSGTATVTLVAPSPITISPSTATVVLGATQQFTASGQASVTWSATAGTISAGGLFTAPATMPVLSSVTITAKGSGNQSATATVTLSAVANPQVSSAAAHRFLQQAAFGPSPSDVANVQALGFQGWINQQFAMAPVSNYTAALSSSQGGLPNLFLGNAVTNPDQLRQRVAFALSQIAVISITKQIWNQNVAPFENMLLNDAFVNYRQILGDVTLSPCMGYYLDMGNNAAANPSQGTVANENYAREVMQLFTIGPNMLNADGTFQTDSSGNLVPTYNQSNVTELARVLTGWTFAPTSGNPQWGINVDGNTNMGVPMVSVAAYHDAGSKNLLNGFVSPAGLTPIADLNGAMDNIFNHQNVGPFISKQLIQHMVKSNPSPAYVARVVAAFNNNGSGVRGDMKAVITAILLDPEARANDNGFNDQPTDGHLQEPVLFLTGFVRALNGQMNSQNYFSSDMANVGQDVFNPASVFNYYSPNYVVPDTGLQGGEFQIYNTFTSIYRANLVSSFFSNYSNPVQTYGPGVTVDLTAYMPLVSNPPALVNALDNTLTGGILPAALKQIVATAVQADAGTTTIHQLQDAVYLILTSNYYNVWH
ncbi:MAG TPA: DUF1800 family protein [Bryobacteraceae bacterium]|jgi:uncharacterized protein (DUF1800 family)